MTTTLLPRPQLMRTLWSPETVYGKKKITGPPQEARDGVLILQKIVRPAVEQGAREVDLGKRKTARALGMDPVRVSRAIKRLHRCGLIEPVEVQSLSGTYRIGEMALRVKRKA